MAEIEAGTPCLNTARPRSAERAALDVAVKALGEVRREMRGAPGVVLIDRALADIETLVPDAVKR